jgi:hypothetical protein
VLASNFADLHLPDLKALLHIAPLKLMRALGGKLVIEGFGLVIIDQEQGCSRRQLIKLGKLIARAIRKRLGMV